MNDPALLRKLLGSKFPNLQNLSDAELEQAVLASLQSREVIVQQAAKTQDQPKVDPEVEAARKYPGLVKPGDAPAVLTHTDEKGNVLIAGQRGRSTLGSAWLAMEEEDADGGNSRGET